MGCLLGIYKAAWFVEKIRGLVHSKWQIMSLKKICLTSLFVMKVAFFSGKQFKKFMIIKSKDQKKCHERYIFLKQWKKFYKKIKRPLSAFLAPYSKSKLGQLPCIPYLIKKIKGPFLLQLTLCQNEVGPKSTLHLF